METQEEGTGRESEHGLADALRRFRFFGIDRWYEAPPEKPDVMALTEAEIESLLAVLRFF